jgi:L-cysteine:1D-myo-inositol 2-amino-2-deoxy-alpha-D-glucopyranoside ligase
MVASVLLHNTLTDRKEPFQPRDDVVGMYVCGVTPYDTTHLGHARTYVVFDVLRRLLLSKGWQVRYVQNVTDIDDDILRKSRQVGIDYLELGLQHDAIFRADMAVLNVLPPDHYPRATQEVPAMIEIIQALLDRGCAYRAGNNIYFHTANDRDYGQLSKYTREQMLALARERGGNPDDPEKQDPLDFLLWQGELQGEPSWPSPWGPGRPGWHIECSAMSRRYLGEPIDIHGGGDDLVFPHHESEIAQDECSGGVRPCVRVWVHSGMVGLDGVKMSKSLGNMVFVRDLLKEVSPDGLRLYLLSYPYRSPWDFDRSRLEQMDQLAGILREAAQAKTRGSGDRLDPATIRARFWAAMDDDLDTPAAIQALADLGDAIHTGLSAGHDVADAQSALRELGAVLGLKLGS